MYSGLARKIRAASKPHCTEPSPGCADLFSIRLFRAEATIAANLLASKHRSHGASLGKRGKENAKNHRVSWGGAQKGPIPHPMEGTLTLPSPSPPPNHWPGWRILTRCLSSARPGGSPVSQLWDPGAGCL